MNVQEFFHLIINTANSGTERLERYLSARGFLIENQDEVLLISDNSHQEDRHDIDEELRRKGIGYVDTNGNIIVQNPKAIDSLRDLFEADSAPNYEALQIPEDWNRFRRHLYGKKVPAMELEPFVARYVKALCACGIKTWSSCDGNHIPPSKKLSVSFIDYFHTAWHALLWNECLSKSFPELTWFNSYTAVKLTETTRYNSYYQLNQAAALLYLKRIQLRNIKHNAAMSISKTATTYKSDEELFELFRNNAMLQIKKLNVFG